MSGAVGVFLVSKGLQLSQVQHGLDHHLQRAHATRPAPPRTLRRVGSDLADSSVLEKMYRSRFSTPTLAVYFKMDFTKLFITFKTQQGGISTLVYDGGFNLV